MILDSVVITFYAWAIRRGLQFNYNTPEVVSRSSAIFNMLYERKKVSKIKDSVEINKLFSYETKKLMS